MQTTQTQTTPSTSPATTPAPDLAAVKAKQNAAWSTGDYAVVGTTLQEVGESICEAVDLHAGERLLDVACGNGNAALAAARRYARVIGIDYVPALLERARERARADRLELEVREADAERLPFEDASFDVVVSTFGVMFTPDQPRAAAEMARACRRGGRIGLASWTPEGFIGQLFRVIGKHVPPPAGLTPPSAWGTEKRLRELFAATATRIETTTKTFCFRYRSPQHFVDVFRTFYGPANKAFAALDAARQPQLEADILALLARVNRATDGTLVAPSEYLEAVITRG